MILNDDTGPLLHKFWNLVAYDKGGQPKPLSEFLHWAYICQSMRELPEQRTKKEYQLRESGKLTHGQLSFVDCLLRKYLGSKKVAMHMCQHGLPRLLAPPGVRARVRRAEQGDSPDAEPELMQALAETTESLMALVCAMSACEEQPELPSHRR